MPMRRHLIVGALKLHGYTERKAEDAITRHWPLVRGSWFGSEENAVDDILAYERHNCGDRCPCDVAEAEWFTRARAGAARIAKRLSRAAERGVKP